MAVERRQQADLWWDRRRRVEQLYVGGEATRNTVDIDQLAAKKGRAFRHELVFLSLGLNNFVTGKDELLAKTVAGYDQQMQLDSLRRLFEAVYGLMEWEAGT